MGNLPTSQSSKQYELTRSNSNHFLESNQYLKQDSIEDVQQIFQNLQQTTKSPAINRNQFSSLFRRYPNDVRDAIFDEFDTDSNGTIDSDEFLRGMALCSSGDLNSKIRFCFNQYDKSGDGFLQVGISSFFFILLLLLLLLLLPFVFCSCSCS